MAPRAGARRPGTGTGVLSEVPPEAAGHPFFITLLLLSTLGGLVLAIIVLWQGLLPLERMPGFSSRDAMQRAMEHQAAGRVRAAVVELKNVLQKNGDNARARLRLGKLYIELNDGAAAEKELLRARSLDRHQWLFPLGRAYLLQQRYQDLLNTVHPQARDSESLRGDHHAMRGLAYLGLEQESLALTELRTALELEPDHPEARLGLSRLRLGEGDYDTAARLARQVLDSKPDHLGARLHLAGVYQLRHDYRRGLEVLDKILERQPAHAMARLGKAELLVALDRLDSALLEIQRLHEGKHRRPFVNYLHGLVHFLKGDLIEADSRLTQVLRQAPDHRPSQLLLGLVHYHLGNLDQAHRYTTHFHESFPHYLPAVKLLVALELRLDRTGHAMLLLERYLPQARDDAQVAHLLGLGALLEHDVEKAVAYLERWPTTAEENRDGQPALLHRVARAIEQTVEGLIPVLLPRLSRDEAQVLSFFMQLHHGDRGAAMTLAGDLSARLRHHHLPAYLLGLVHVQQNAYSQARAAFRQALQQSPDFVPAQVRLGDIAWTRNRTDMARRWYERVLAVRPAHPRASLRLALLAQRQGRSRQATELLQQAWSGHPGHPEVGLALIHQWLDQGDKAAALAVARALHDANPNTFGAVKILGQTALLSDEYTTALGHFRAALRLRPDSVRIWHLLGLTHLRLQARDEATAALEKALSLQPDHLPTLKLLARLALQEERFEAALDYARRLREQPAGVDDSYRLEGDIYMQRQWFGPAADAYQQGYDRSRDLTLAELADQARRRLAGP